MQGLGLTTLHPSFALPFFQEEQIRRKKREDRLEKIRNNVQLKYAAKRKVSYPEEVRTSWFGYLKCSSYLLISVASHGIFQPCLSVWDLRSSLC